jgi:hypothetical protein
MDFANRRECTSVRHVLGVVMAGKKAARQSERPSVLDVVALLADRSGDELARGQVGTVVELLDENTALVEFSDEQGRAYAIATCPQSELLVLHYVPQAA